VNEIPDAATQGRYSHDDHQRPLPATAKRCRAKLIHDASDKAVRAKSKAEIMFLLKKESNIIAA
jgi:hypothetical protein